MPSEPYTGNGTNGIHHYSPHYFFVRRERLAEVVKVIHLICRWRLLFLGLSPQEALAPFEHLPFLFSTFFAPRSRFQPPNLLGSLMGIAKGIASDLLAHTDMEPWWFIGLAAPAAGNESHHDSSVDGEECSGNGVEAMPMLVPISRRFVVCQTSCRTAKRARDDGKKSDDSGDGDVPVGREDEVQSIVENDDRQAQLLASHLKNANIALTIVLRSDVAASSGGDDSRPSYSSAAALLTSLRSNGLAILDLSAPLDAVSDTLAESTDANDPGTSPPIAASPSASDEFVVERFLDACEQTPGTIAVSSASLFAATNPGESSNSVATCIGCYLMKHHSFTSQEAVG